MPETAPDTDPGASPDADSGSEEPRLWQVKIAVIATSAEHEELMDRLADVLCPDPDHEGPCPVPWGMHSVNGDSLTDEERSALLTEIEETNWDPEEDPKDGGGREQ
ncbi:hypothetical protein IQ279_20425 [Streptomyces verrucosisporus]|uniref:hypothetical protein n=1 Tax=Streptomyces verrucosisporus TaxID=1695161 RepID=UPI0019D1C030|nr:hypothetical protein [Streptomyces verrucosisporus]MBN3931963.1 hypothetical protein [Streptomyces verrucosisporus]